MSRKTFKEAVVAISDLLQWFDGGDAESLEKLKTNFEQLTCGKRAALLIRSTVIKASGADVYEAMLEEVLAKEADIFGSSGPSTRSSTNLQSWNEALRKQRDESKRDEAKHGTEEKVSRAGDQGGAVQPRTQVRFATPAVAKVTLELPTYDGSRGKAGRWWKRTRNILHQTYPRTDDAGQMQWIPLITNNCLKPYPTGQKQFEQIQQAHARGGDVKLDDVMAAFVAKHDQHSEEALMQEFRSLQQKNRESINEYHVRFIDLVEDLKEQGIDIPKSAQWMTFKISVRQIPELQKRPDIKTIDAAVKYLLQLETSGVQKPDSSIHYIPGKPGGKPTKLNGRKNKNLRCHHCQRKGHLVAECRDKQRGKPKTSLKDRQKIENKRGKKGKNFNTISKEIQEMKRAMGSFLGHVRPPQEDETDGMMSMEDIRQTFSVCNNVNSVDPGKTMHKSRKISMAMVSVEHGKNECKRRLVQVPALQDTGALCDSYIKLQTVQDLGLQKLVEVHRKVHGTAKEGQSFNTIGTVPISMHFGQTKVTHDFHVAPDLGVELLFGHNLLERLGAVIDIHNKKIHYLNIKDTMKNGKKEPHVLHMLRMDQWSQVSGIRSSDFDHELPVPDEHKKKYPGKTLKQIADELEKIPEDEDWTVEQGRAYINKLLDTKYKCITEPRKEPSKHLKPVRLPVKPQYQGMVVNTPVRARADRDWDRIENQVHEWAKQGKVVKSMSPWNTPHVVAPKATPPFFRLAQDFRRLNRILESRKFPVRKIDYLVDGLANKRYKTGLDWWESYMQIPVDKRDQHMLAFSTRDGKWHFTVVPFGVSISGDLFCEVKSGVMNHDGGGTLLWHFIWSYVDDDAIGTNRVKTHIFVLECIFERLKRFGLVLRRKKCKFLVDEIKYVGHIVGHKVIRPDPEKVKVIDSMPKKPSTLKELKAFLGKTSWHFRKYAPDYAELSQTITRAFRKPNDKKPFDKVWNDELQRCYDKIKDLCKRELLNVAFDKDAEDTKLWFDYSRVGIGAVLTQNGRIVRVWGRACNDAESRYSPTKGEMLAFTEAQLKFRPYLLSLQHGFLAVTDHRPLLGIVKKLDLENNDLAILRTKTEEFRPHRTLVYVNGDRNLADGWSRLWPAKKLPEDADTAPIVAFVTLDDGDFIPDDEDTQELNLRRRKYGLQSMMQQKHVEVKTGGQSRIFVPQRSRQALLYGLHLPDHAGERELMRRLMNYYWPKKLEQVRTFLQACRCHSAKSQGNPRNESKES